MQLNDFMEITKQYTRPLNSLNGSEAWIIKVDGEQVKMPSGKIVWSRKGAASSALGNAIKHAVFDKLRKYYPTLYNVKYEIYDGLMKQAKDSGKIQIVQLS